MNCHKCSAQLPKGAKFCPDCGAEVTAQKTVECKNCNTENPAQAKFCKSCGDALKKPTKKAPATKKLPLSNQYALLLSVAIIALIIAAIYYYIGFIKPVEGKQKVQQQQTRTVEEPNLNTSSGQMTQAPSEEQIEQAAAQLKQNPNDAELNTKMGNLLFDSGKYSEAIPYYQKSIQLQPNNPDVIVDLGVCYFNLEQYEKAKEQFELAYQIDSQHVNALYNLGVVSIQLGEVNKLIKYWGELRDIAPNSQQAQRATQILNQIHQNVEQGAGSGQGQGS